MKKRILGSFVILILVLVLKSSIVSALTVEGVLYHSSVRKGSIFRWRIEKVTSDDNPTNWIWKWANFVNLSQGEYITLEWKTSPDPSLNVNDNGALNYTGLQINVGSRLLNNTRNETFFNFLIAPLYINNSLGIVDSGLNALERLWFNSYYLPSADLPFQYNEYIWNFDMENASLSNTGDKGQKNSIVLGHITTPSFFSGNEIETYVFDVAFDAVTGIVKWIKYPSRGLFNFPIANSTHRMTDGLSELIISYVGQDSITSFEIPIILIGLLIVTGLAIRKRKNR